MVSDDYFVNHRRARQFPWSLYHGPIEADLERFLGATAAARPGARVLVIGCGLAHELDRAPASLGFTAVDVDPRCVEAVRARRDPRVTHLEVVAPDADLAHLGTFDAVYTKEVIEHIVPYAAHLAALHRVVGPGGRIWMSTPNYGEPWLPAIESTILELVARLSGFTRRGVHPSRFSSRSLAGALADAGFADIRVRTIAFRLALIAEARRP